MNRLHQLQRLPQKPIRRIGLLGLSFLIVSAQILAIFVATPKVVIAATPPSEYKVMEMSWLIRKCIDEQGLANYGTGDSLADRWIFGGGNGSNAESTVEKVNKKKYNVSPLVDNDGSMECASAVLTTFTAAGINYENDYVKHFFERVPESKENGYRLKEGYTHSDLSSFIKGKFDAKGWSERPISYVAQALNSAFSECVTTTSELSYDPQDEYMFEYDGKYYKLKGGEGKGDRRTDKKVGLFIDKDDGIWSCGELMKKLKAGGAFAESKSLKEILLGNAVKEAQENQNEQAKLDAIKEVFDGNTTVLNNCIAAVSSAFASTTTEYKKNTMAAWLAAGGTGPITISPGGRGSQTISAENAAIIGKCLNDDYGSALAEAAATELDFGDPNNEDGADSEGDSCYDTVDPLFTIPLTGVKVPNPLKWAVCGISQLLASFIDQAGEAVASYLSYDPFNDQGADSLKGVWSNILRVANILFVLAFLIMVLSTILDLGLFSNYTVKKLLPRIIIAALLANLSWEISRILTDITLAIGGATKEVILSPLGGMPDAETSIPGQAMKIFNADQGAITLGVGALIYATIASAGAILLPVLATIAVAVLVAFAVLALRRIIIVLLIVLAPLALIAMAFPGGDSLAKRWWKTFIQLLFMYPIIMALFASGIFLSEIVGSSRSNVVETLTQAFVLFMPFFALPYVFKMAGGALANVTGMVNDRSKGLIDRSRKWRDEGSQYGRRKQLKAQRKNYTGHEKLIKSMGADKLAGSEWLARRRRSQGLGRNWAQGGETKETQRAFLDKMEAAVSKEQKDAADFRAQSAGGGIEVRRRDGDSKAFRVIRAGDDESKAIWLGKDAAIAEAWKGARVDAMEEKYDENGQFKGYTDKVEGTLFDGSKAAQRAAGSLAGAQALTPVIDAVRNGDNGRNKWELYDPKTGKKTGNLHTMPDYATQFRTGNAEAREAAQVAGSVMAEVKGGYAQNLMGKMPSFVKGDALAFGGIQAESLSNFHENEVVRMVDYAASGKDPATWARVGQSVKQIVENPEKYNMSPKSLAELKTSYGAHAGADATLDTYMNLVNSDGTIQRVASDGSQIPKVGV